MKILWPLSILYRVFVWLRNILYDFALIKSHGLPGTVISVGNIALGGTGKSPVVLSIVESLLSAGYQPAIVTRGYRSGLTKNEWQVLLSGKVIAGAQRPGLHADEALMQSMKAPSVPIIVGANRYAAVQEYLKFETGNSPSHWILDDGFQHRKIRRDLDIVVIDGRQPYGHLLPAGYFREPISALKRAQVVLISKCSTQDMFSRTSSLIKTAFPNLPVFGLNFIPQNPLQVFGDSAHKPQNWLAVCAIAKPLDFLKNLGAIGIDPVKKIIENDHQRHSLSKLKNISIDVDAIITTEKDWARDADTFKSIGRPIYVLPIKINWFQEIFSASEFLLRKNLNL